VPAEYSLAISPPLQFRCCIYIANPPLKITLNHQAVAFYAQAIRLPADNFPLQQLDSCSVPPRLKKLFSSFSVESLALVHGLE